MAKKKRKDCLECIAYCNLLRGSGYMCGLGFEVVEDLEEGKASGGLVFILMATSVKVSRYQGRKKSL